MNKRPGELNDFPPRRGPHRSFSKSAGTSVAPICCVIPPASRSMTLACLPEPNPRMWSNNEVFP